MLTATGSGWKEMPVGMTRSTPPLVLVVAVGGAVGKVASFGGRVSINEGGVMLCTGFTV